ncbi:nucleotidyltransferase domain-containing protein [Inquilinus sp.]|uniref:nucleotidyltransferase domain-containing protein n=1 Tax=Inquilinus sp. TaxID=1932117 RepID=UPI0031D51EB0
MTTRTARTEAALATARSVLAERYPDAHFAFVAGSIMRGQGTPHSDIDLVVMYGGIDRARRESFRAGGFPVEAFVHDRGTLRWFLDQDIARGRPSILTMVAEGRLVGPVTAGAEALRSEAAALLAKGPPPLTPERRDALRYEITDMVDDLRDHRPRQEMLAIGAALHQRLADLILLGHGRWTGSGKWIPRLLAAFDQSRSRDFEEAFRSLFADGRADHLIAFAEAELGHHGGPLFEGDRREAPLDARSSPA